MQFPEAPFHTLLVPTLRRAAELSTASLQIEVSDNSSSTNRHPIIDDFVTAVTRFTDLMEQGEFSLYRYKARLTLLATRAHPRPLKANRLPSPKLLEARFQYRGATAQDRRRAEDTRISTGRAQGGQKQPCSPGSHLFGKPRSCRRSERAVGEEYRCLPQEGDWMESSLLRCAR